MNQLYTWFGCKKKIIDRVWSAWGDVSIIAEPFAGTATVSLNRPDNHNVKNAYLNDYDCHIVNVMRSVLYYPDDVISAACHPRIEMDMHQIHDYLVSYANVSLRDHVMSGINACDPMAAGWWIWGCNNWIGGNWGICTIKPDEVFTKNNTLRDLIKMPDDEQLLEATRRKKPKSYNEYTERLAPKRYQHIHDLVYNVYRVLRDTRILYGDFARVLTESYLDPDRGRCGILLDPPYPDTDDGKTYNKQGHGDCFDRALKWFIDNNDNEKYRSIFCCREHNLINVDIPDTVRKEVWSADGGYAHQAKALRHTEVLLYSKGCLK